MSPTSLLDTPLTLIQAQQAAALDDLLRFIVVNDGCRWDAIEKKMGKVSYEGLYEVCVAETVRILSLPISKDCSGPRTDRAVGLESEQRRTGRIRVSFRQLVA